MPILRKSDLDHLDAIRRQLEAMDQQVAQKVERIIDGQKVMVKVLPGAGTNPAFFRKRLNIRRPE
jgi:hypothetical protein